MGARMREQADNVRAALERRLLDSMRFRPRQIHALHVTRYGDMRIRVWVRFKADCLRKNTDLMAAVMSEVFEFFEPQWFQVSCGKNVDKQTYVRATLDPPEGDWSKVEL